MAESAGFVVLHRRLLDWEWYDDANVMRLFIHGILRANHAPQKWRGTLINRGQFISSYEKLAQELKLTKKQIRIAQTKLEETGEWAHEGHTQHTVFTIKNYSLYQDKGTPTELPTELPRADEGHTKGTRGAPNNNDNNENNETKNLKTLVQIETGFDQFWLAYPKKKSKGQAEKSWAKLKPNSELVGKILSSLALAKCSQDWLKESGMYIPHPATWLNAKGWEDEVFESRAGPVIRHTENVDVFQRFLDRGEHHEQN